MSNLKLIRFLILLLMFGVLIACGSKQLGPTEMPELNNVIEIVLSGDVEAQRSLIRFTQTECTNAEGLGGPPKCLAGETEGASVDVLPLLGPEGSFIRRDEIEDWDGLHVSELFAAYEVSEAVYSDENYPRGEYALVFIESNENLQMSVTLQVTDGRIAN